MESISQTLQLSGHSDWPSFLLKVQTAKQLGEKRITATKKANNCWGKKRITTMKNTPGTFTITYVSPYVING
jgi:hypothetical protein